MHQVKHNKNNTIHGTYRSNDVTLKLLMDSKPSSLATKIDAFLEGDEGTLIHPFCSGVMLKLSREGNDAQITFSRTLDISKQTMDGILNLLRDMCDASNVDRVAASSTNLLVQNEFESSNTMTST